MNTPPNKPMYDLQERLIDFAVLMLEISDGLPSTFAGRHFSNQLTRSGTSPGMHYGEAQAAESARDFIHKMKVCLKELRESWATQRIIERTPLFPNHVRLQDGIRENIELVAIFSASIRTAEKGLKK